jgi:hypothetical protein
MKARIELKIIVDYETNGTTIADLKTALYDTGRSLDPNGELNWGAAEVEKVQVSVDYLP